MFKRVLPSLSLISQITLLMLLLGLLGIGGMSLAAWMAGSIEGNAHAINKAGSLRMQSYRLLSEVPLQETSARYISQMETDQNSADLLQAVERENLQPQFLALRQYWQTTLRNQLLTAKHPQDVSANIAVFVGQLDELVAALEHKTEYHLQQISLIQRGLLVVTLLLMALTIWFLRRHLLTPWKSLLAQASAITAGDFSRRYQRNRVANGDAHNEMDILGDSLNSMSLALAEMVDNLAQRVAEKTADLQQKNQMLDYLYRVSRQLHTSAPPEARMEPVLKELQSLTPLSGIQLRQYENNSAEVFNEFSHTSPRQPDIPEVGEHAQDGGESLSWSLRDDRENYGVLLAQLPPGQYLDDDQQQLIHTLLEQLTSTLMLARQAEHQQQLMLMEERSAIARELHDSLAQSLSCLKIQVACLQMHADAFPEEDKNLLLQMREELNTAYRQLRELLTTFRLTLNTPGLHAALQHTVDEFSRRMGLAIDFDYQIPPRSVPANQGIHLLHIAREALNNVYKHANATRVSLSLQCHDGEISMNICDNGDGISQDIGQQNHYGLIIMQDRASTLHGKCRVARCPEGGTEVTVRFRPEALPVNPQEQV
ncbi:nitrate/nitrite two-component system sensor histidine kinase NarX [Rahnella sp. SL6]|uniref:nitrate/nitrite two-component system sensor histidine kinase NarX n=1 Tax=Rahnella perminowiae TaxID=2816244 RepID=UPI001C2712A5|nr:nitrate/nitrite two-component system sensor histidine kinase NarX [Rahnella perminowiae]MBU9811886.1 nitrate/nitrite two-component system sensor histidine kinase NarX [Rahnella perminowiae]